MYIKINYINNQPIIKVNYVEQPIYIKTSIDATYIKVDYGSGGSSGAVWGGITGTLSAQTDLQSALDLKVPTSRTLTINGTSYDLSANRTWSVGDMLKSVYDVDNDGIVDDAEKITIIARNSTGSTLYRGTIVYLQGSTGNRPNALKAQANSEATSSGTFGVVVDDILNNADGHVAALGTLHDLDTRDNAPNPFTSDVLVDGDALWLSPTTAGYVTKTKPTAPNHAVFIGTVARTTPNFGRIVYRIQNGYELYELHDVQIGSYINNDLLYRDTSTNLWKNAQLNTIIGYTPQVQLNGTGFVKASGTTISYDNSTYLTTNQSISISGAVTGSGSTAITTTLANSVVGISNLSASGTPSATTYLRGDNTWATVSGGSSSYSVSTKTTTYTETATSGEIILLANSTSATFTINLATAVGNTSKVTIKKIASANQVIIDGNGTQTIDGGLTATINKLYESITLISDNANWQII
jgi:hypothetical protein